MTDFDYIKFHDFHEIVDALSTALDAKSSYTCGHSDRVATISMLLAQDLGLSVKDQQIIHVAAHLHDIGKIGVPDNILNKPGKLTAEEFAIIKQHPVVGFEIVNKISHFSSIAEIVRHHHEKFDGTGYPDQLKSHEISIGAKIVALADSFDAMISKRSYKQALSINEALNEAKRCVNTQFDPLVVYSLSKIIENGSLKLNCA